MPRPVDILYLGVLTAEHFPLQLELPDIGESSPSRAENVERDFSWKNIGFQKIGKHMKHEKHRKTDR